LRLKSLIFTLIISVALFPLPAVARTFSPPSGDSLLPMHILLYTGDDPAEKHEINIYSRGGKYFADNLAPFYYAGKKTDGVWTTELSRSKIAACHRFMDKARKAPAECPDISNSSKNYQITYGTESIHIEGDCDWGDMGYFDLRSVLFGDKFAKLDTVRLLMSDSVSKLLTGKWYFRPLKTKLRKGVLFVLSRETDRHRSCFWEFGKNSYFKSSCNDALNLTYSNKYVLSFDGDTYFEVQGGATRDKNGNLTIRNFGAMFTIESIDSEYLKIRYLHR
jgi:hypothetical protein